MDLKELVTPGATLEIIIGSISAKTKVEELLDQTRFVVEQPTHRMVPIYMVTGEAVVMMSTRPNGLFSFRARYEGRTIRDNLSFSRFQAVSDVEKSQRRYSYRLPVVLKGTVRMKQVEGGEKPVSHTLLTVNLSEEGVLFMTQTPFMQGDHVTIDLEFNEAERLMVNGEVIRAMEPERYNDPVRVAVKFVNMPKRDRLQLSKFIMDQQVKIRRTSVERD